ncbi:recombinase family protein [Alienimonas sp. DA493]|uniref:recombinase family protein n=1 Tax=Alienimonas sp. DA493 TaxID=3373605 RepID=UPI003755175A
MATEKKLRIGALVRVSSERQESKGESLPVQRQTSERNAAALGGTVVEWYDGQEHATPGWERAELDRLMADAEAGRLDAVIVSDLSRWSRDSATGLPNIRKLKKLGVRFFEGTTEVDPHDPGNALSASIQLSVLEHQAAVQRKKSIESRIHRAKRGVPTCGKLPFGRTFDKKTETWGVDPEKQAMIEDVAARYLAGASIQALAEEYGRGDANLYKTLAHKCGDTWEQSFKLTDFGIDETVQTPVPRLLPEETIRAVRERAVRGRTYAARGTGEAYLLSSMVFCAECGFALTGIGARTPGGPRYYRHGVRDNAKKCPLRPRPHVRGDDLEAAVIRELFDLFGNPAMVQRAIEKAQPDPDGAADLRARADRLNKRLTKLNAGRDRVLKLILDDKVTEEQAAARLDKANADEAKLREELNAVNRQLTAVPNPDGVRAAAEAACDAWGARVGVVSARRRMVQHKAAYDFEALSPEDRRALVEMVFVGRTPDGNPAGVYVEPIPGQKPRRPKRWRFHLRGLLMDATAETGGTPGHQPLGASLQRDLLKASDGARPKPGRRGRPRKGTPTQSVTKSPSGWRRTAR